jgi:protocatechuate 3,4-dioxygenase beta subunit
MVKKMRFKGKMYQSILIIAVIFLAIIIAAAILSQTAKTLKPKPSVVNNGPLDIRLVGVCPDGGQQLYDASGRKLKAATSALGAFHTCWKDEDQYRDFLFEVPDVNSQVVFLPFPRICPAGTNRGLSSGLSHYFDPTNNPATLIYSTTFDRTYRKKFFFFRFDQTIQYIDLTLRYLYGSRGQATCTFTGPFTMNQTVRADGAKPYYLTFQEGITLDGSGIILRLETSEYFGDDIPAIVYDISGRRYVLNSHGGGGSGKTGQQYRGIVISPEKIAAVTFGEKPHEITFKDVAVDYPDLPNRTHPEFLDEMAKRLGLTDTSSKYLVQYKFKNPQEALDVIDIVRGDYIRHVFEAIRYGKTKIDITKLDKATQEKIRRAATEWAKTRHLARYGISLGLMGRWPEFFDIAIERLGRQTPYANGYWYYEQTWRQDNAQIANTMVNYRLDQLTAEQVQKIKELILKTDEGSVLRYLIWYLNWIKSQATTDALWELAQNDKPWIWWKAIESWYSHTSRRRQVYDDLSEKMKLRLILAKDEIRDENREEEALKLLPEIFTPELGKMASDVWNKVRERITRQFDRKAATEIFVNYLRQLQSEMTVRQWTSNSSFNNKSKWMTAYIIRTLNVWYGTNIANLGTDETGDWSNQEPRSFYEFQNLITQPIEWYDENSQATPVKLPFAGKVVDTAGNPIAGAKLSFTKREDYKDEQGYRSQRIVDVGQCTTNADGEFSFSDFTNDGFYTFGVIADGYLPKEELHIQHLTDGRYRYHEKGAPEDNIVVLQRPGKISGIVIGADGKPLADAELWLSDIDLYSEANSRKTIAADSEGKFNAEDVSKGHFLLSYADLRKVTDDRGYRREYGGLCGAVRLETEEAGHLTDVVLDLSKSDCSLELQIVDDANKPVQDVNINFNAEMKGGSYKYAPLFYVNNTSSHNGLYRFEGMPPGAWRLRVSDSNKQLRRKEININLTPGKTACYKVIFE